MQPAAAPSRPLQVLVIEDHAPLRQQLAGWLQLDGHHVDEASEGRLGLALALQQLPEVVVLDVNLPGLDGMALCRALRAQAPRHVPVLMLTARDTLPDKLEGFAAGTDDYLVKPFAADELRARVLALARRRTAGQDWGLKLGPLQIDRRSREALRDGRRLNLPPTAFAILELLVDAWPKALTRSELIHRLWNDEPPDSDPLRTHLYQLRRQLDRPSERPLLTTVHGVGYRLDIDAPGMP